MDKTIQDQLLGRIDSFDGDIGTLTSAIKDLDAVWQSESWVEPTKREFRDAWSELEQINAIALDRGGTWLTEAEIVDARAALSLLRSLVGSAR